MGLKIMLSKCQLAVDELPFLGHILALDDPNRQFVIMTDDCKDGLGSILSQPDENGELSPYTLRHVDVLQPRHVTFRRNWRL